MNSVIENILNRRSVRHYEHKPVEKAMLEIILQAASYAPSGNNAQAWRFVVITDPKVRAKLAALCLPIYKQWMAKAPEDLQAKRREIDAKVADPIYYGAPAVIFVIGTGMTSDFDCSMACQNMMLASRSLNLGSCWVFFGQLATSHPEVRVLLELKEHEKIYGPILIGYPKEGFPAAPEKKKPEVKWI